MCMSALHVSADSTPVRNFGIPLMLYFPALDRTAELRPATDTALVRRSWNRGGSRLRTESLTGFSPGMGAANHVRLASQVQQDR